VTDASLLLGYLNPENFYGGRMDLAAEKDRVHLRRGTRRPAGRVGHRGGVARVRGRQREHGDGVPTLRRFPRPRYPRAFDDRSRRRRSSHAFRVARKLDIDEVVCPYGAGVGSSIGLTEAPRMYEASSTSQAVLETLSAEDFERQFASLREEAASVLERAGIDPDETEASLSLDMRHVDQGHEIKVPLEGRDIDDVTPDIAREAFERTYEETFNRETLEFPVEVLTYRLELSEGDRDAETSRLVVPDGESAEPDSRDVYFGGEHGSVATDVYRWDELTPDESIDGPVVVEADQTTVVADPDSTLTVADNYDITIEL